MDTQVVGVAALTSFTKEGQKRIQENTPLYLDAVTELGTLISDHLKTAVGDQGSASQDHLLQSALDVNSQPMVLADPTG